jgi:hypothetical protein
MKRHLIWNWTQERILLSLLTEMPMQPLLFGLPARITLFCSLRKGRVIQVEGVLVQVEGVQAEEVQAEEVLVQAGCLHLRVEDLNPYRAGPRIASNF